MQRRSRVQLIVEEADKTWRFAIPKCHLGGCICKKSLLGRQPLHIFPFLGSGWRTGVPSKAPVPLDFVLAASREIPHVAIGCPEVRESEPPFAAQTPDTSARMGGYHRAFGARVTPPEVSFAGGG